MEKIIINDVALIDNHAKRLLMKSILKVFSHLFFVKTTPTYLYWFFMNGQHKNSNGISFRHLICPAGPEKVFIDRTFATLNSSNISLLTTYKTVRIASFVQKKIATFCSLVSICDKKRMRCTIISATSNEQFATETFTNGFQLKNETTKTAAASATTTSDDDEFEVITSRLHARKMEHQQQQNIVKMCLTQKAQNHQCCQLFSIFDCPYNLTTFVIGI